MDQTTKTEVERLIKELEVILQDAKKLSAGEISNPAYRGLLGEHHSPIRSAAMHIEVAIYRFYDAHDICAKTECIKNAFSDIHQANQH